jgi:hypothetical protein
MFVYPDYQNSRCQSYSLSTDSPTGRKKLQTDSGVNYFEKICLRGVRCDCNTFFFDRSIDPLSDISSISL